MRTLRTALLGALVLAAGAWLALQALDPLHAARAAVRREATPSWFPSANVLRFLSLGHEATVADVIYLWSIQRFSDPDPDPARRAQWLQRVYGTITDLDPRFRDAYWLGFVSLLSEGRSPEGAFALADKALENDPEFTFMAIEAAMTARQLQRRDLVIRYLEAGSRAGDPAAMRFLTKVRSEELATAQQELAAWAELLDVPDEFTRAIAESHVRDLRVVVDVAVLEALAACHARDRGILPGSLQQLQRAGYLAEVPLDPEGRPYEYDGRTGTVRSTTPFRHRPPSHARQGVDLSALGRCARPSPP